MLLTTKAGRVACRNPKVLVRAQTTGQSQPTPTPTQSDDIHILLSTRENIEGQKVVQEFGIVTGCSVQARTFWHDISCRVLGFFGGDIPPYGTLLERATQEATRKMMEAAKEQGANCVLRTRTQVSITSDPTAGVFCYCVANGTAVEVTKE
eukprot:TRINITY_DN402_c0_g1_i2.p1 TRINITY_DN402_c0_g1~~TRINITY_DN402_c0_g1_i2.p1  ORF type:complete len:160 (-),score=23.53 TRINITY_DN402_c0_g1_i2:89-541(-)